MSSSTSDELGASTPFRWPLGTGMVRLLVLTTVGAAGLLGSVADPILQVGSWGYVAWAVAAIVALLTVRSAAVFARDGARSGSGSGRESGLVERLPIETSSPHDPPMVERFRRRMGGWGTFVAGVAQFHAMLSASGVVALVVSGTLLQASDGVVRAGAVAFLVLAVLARAWLREPPRVVSLVVLTAVIAGLVAIGVHLELVEGRLTIDSARPRAPLSVEAVLQATALLPIAFLPLMRMGVMVPGLPHQRRRPVRRWIVPLAALAAAGLGAFLGEAVEGALDPASSTGTALASAVSECPRWFGVGVQVVTLVLGALTVLVLVDDCQVIGGRLARLNSVTDVFSPPPGKRIAVSGELFVLGLAVVAVAVAPSALGLLAYSAFSVLVLFGSIHVAVMRPTREGRHRIAVAPMLALGVSVALIFSLPPVAILAGVALISITILMRALLIVWSQPLPPDVVEGLEGLEGTEGPDGFGGLEVPGLPGDRTPRGGTPRRGASAAASGRPEDAPRDLSTDDGARGPQHRPER